MDLSSYLIGFAAGISVVSPALIFGRKKKGSPREAVISYLESHNSFTIDDLVKANPKYKGFFRKQILRMAVFELMTAGVLKSENLPGTSFLNRDRTVLFIKQI